MNHAVQLMSQHPTLTYGNIFEIRPAGDMSEIIEASQQRQRQNTACRLLRDELPGAQSPAMLSVAQKGE